MFQKPACAALALFLAAELGMAQTGIPRTVAPVRVENSPRVHELIRAGNLYLSLQEALGLAIENNLDIELQQESIEAEQAKFEVGASTSFFVMQYESLLAQARSTEVAALSSYAKAKAALQRATATILEENRITMENALKGR